MLKLLKKKLRRAKKIKLGQVYLEFIFSLSVLFIAMYGLVKVFEWSGKDLLARRQAHDNTLTNVVGLIQEYEFDTAHSSLRQVHPFFYFPESMNAVWPEAM